MRISRQNRTLTSARLIIAGLLLILVAGISAKIASALQDPASPIPQEAHPILYTWKLIDTTDEVSKCTLVVDHPGVPTQVEIDTQCAQLEDDEAKAESQACTENISYGAGSGCAGLYLQMVGTQPDSPYAKIVLHQPVWNITTISDNLPLWLSIPDNSSELNTEGSLALLAGHLISKNYVDASSCPALGLLPNGAANSCGEVVARPAVIDWQNQFDTAIYNAALQTNIPPHLLKNIIIQETQFWPASSTNRSNTEYGFGHMTQNGADTMLSWNNAFFNGFCPSILNEYSCAPGYFMMPAAEKSMLRGALLQAVNADCPSCSTGLDFEKATEAIPVFAHALAASGKQVERMIQNVTGKNVDLVVGYEDLWRFTAANYNAGPWCLNVAFNETLRVGEKLRWKRIANHLPKECEGVIQYVENVTRSGEIEEPPTEQTSIVPPPALVSPPAAIATPLANNPKDLANSSVAKTDETVEVIVQFKPVLSLLSGFAIRAANGEEQGKVEGLRNVIVDLPAEEYAESLEKLRNSWLVAYAEPNASVRAFGAEKPIQPQPVPADRSQALAQSEATSSTLVAVIDTGVDINHPALKDYIWLNEAETGINEYDSDRRYNGLDEDRNDYVDDWSGWNFVDDNNAVTDTNGHGTHTAGIIVEQSSGTARILPVKALDAYGFGNYAQVAEAIIYAVDQGAKIVHLGFGGLEASRTLQEAVDYAYERGVTVISAAGNTGNPTLWYPAALPRVIAVGAVDANDQLANFSSIGEHISLVAPGVDIISAYPGGGTMLMSGTSMSAAHISGFATLLASLSAYDTPDKIRAALQNTALDLGEPGQDIYYGYGLVQNDEALAYVITEEPTPVPWAQVEPTPLISSSGGVHSMATEVFWGSTTACTGGTLANEANALTPTSFDGSAGSCNGVKAANKGWTYTDFTPANTSFTTFTSASVEIRYYLANYLNDDYRLQISNDNGGSWTDLELFTTGNLPPSTLTAGIYDVSALFTTATQVDQAQIRIWAVAKNGNPANTVDIYFDQVALTIDGAGAVNNPPVANDDSDATPKNVTLNVAANGVLGNDTDPDSDPVTAVPFSGSTAPAGSGTVTLLADGSYTYVPQAGFTGDATFTYYANDGTVDSTLAATVTITVSNTAPVAVADPSYSTPQDTTLNEPAVSGVLANDSDANGDSLTAVLDSGPSNAASFTLNPDGSFDYAPNPGWSGTDSFTYHANDGTANSATVTATITVTSAGNNPPVANDDTDATPKNVTLNVAANGVLGNDTDPDSDPVTAVPFSGSTAPAGSGTVTLLADGSYTYVPQAGFTGDATFTYYANDGTVDSTLPATVTITVSNTAPVAVDDSYSTPEDTTLNEAAPGVLPNDTDANGDTLTAVAFSGNTAPVNSGTVTLNADGSFAYVPQTGFNDDATFTYSVNDGTVDSASPATVTITVGSPPITNPHGGYGAMTDTCAQCHRTHTAQGPNLIASLEINNSYCFTCHDGSGVNLASSVVSTHSNVGFADTQEAPDTFTLLCVQCHDPHGSSNLSAVRPDVRVTTSPLLTTGPVDFTARTGATDSFDDGTSPTSTRICTACHVNPSNPGFAMSAHDGGANHSGGVNYETEDCTTCHKHDLDGTYSSNDGFMPDGCTGCHAAITNNNDGTLDATGRRAIVGEFAETSHHVSGALTDADCVVCHNQSTHQTGTVRLINADNGATIYGESAPGAFRTANLTAADNTALTAFCQSCHDGDGALKEGTPLAPFNGATSPPKVGTHSNNDFSGVEVNFSTGCAQCHESHGSSNLSLINDVEIMVNVSLGTTSGPIVFTSLTNADSFDETDATEDEPNNRDDICAACHLNANNPGFAMTQHSGGDHTGGALGSDERDTDCTGCHTHDLDDDPATLDGFMPSGGSCTGCHSGTQNNTDGLPDPTNLSGRRAVVGEFALSTHHVSGALDDADCEVCHDQTNHMNGFVKLYNPDTGAQIIESASGAFRTANLTAGDVTNLTTFCQGCHDGDGGLRLGGNALTPFTGGTNPLLVGTHSNTNFTPRVEGVFSTGCVQCHSSHGSDNLSIVNGTILVTPGTTTGTVGFTATSGANSFDEIDSPENNANNLDDICVTCHINANNPPGDGMLQHSGGDHTGGALGTDQRGVDCTSCHPHDLDDDPSTLDGFMPSGGSCVGCHSSTTGALPRRQIVDSNADGSGTGGDFKRASHHMSSLAIPTDADCEVCHDQSAHMAGTVRLFNVDTGIVAADYEESCLSCHDANGANGDTTPFSDGAAVLNISSNWSAASHNTSGSVGSCANCHDNGHGSNKVSMLAPWNYGGDADDDPWNAEEQFCYDCHDSNGPASSDVQTRYTTPTNWANAIVGTNSMVDLNDRHDITATDQARSGAKIECVNCHDPHIANAANPLIADPDPGDGRVPASLSDVAGANVMTYWCMDCHDGSYPTGVVDAHADDGGTPVGLFDILTFWNGDNNKDDTHGAQNGGTGSITVDGPPDTDGWIEDITVQCMDCHVRHVSDATAVTGGTNLFQLKTPTRNRTDTFDLFTNATAGLGTLNYELTIVSSFVSDQQNGFSWCNSCHDGTQMKSGDPNCTSCHMHGSRW